LTKGQQANKPLYEEARRLRREQGLSASKIADQLAISRKTITRWVQDIELTPDQTRLLYIDRATKGAAAVRKDDLRAEARRLRQEQGLSVKQIAATLNVAQSSVSTWVRDVELTEEQRADLEVRRRNHLPTIRTRASATNVGKFRALREAYQNEGRERARQGDPLHLAGCMLFWAEGTKGRNALSFINSDPGMLSFYIRFLREALQVQPDDIVVHINCYLNNGLSLDEIESHWLNLLQLPRSCMRNTIVNAQPRSSQQKGRKLLYGVCALTVHKTQLVQHVYGAIQEYTGIDKPEWLE
jgi:transcriptional regulator with XRE-family HTH domain